MSFNYRRCLMFLILNCIRYFTTITRQLFKRGKYDSRTYVNKWILGGLCFLVLFSGVCYLFHEHSIALFSQQLADTDVRSQLVLSKNDQINRQPKVSTPEMSKSEENLTESSENRTENADLFVKEVIHDDIGLSTEKRFPEPTKRPVSFNGFGPFPEIPVDYPAQKYLG